MATFEDIEGVWQTVQPKAGGSIFGNAPDGNHTARITITMDHKDGNDIIRFRYYFPALNISEVEYLYVDQNKVGVIKAKLRSLGLEAKSAAEASAAFCTVKDWVCEVEKKTNGKYRNFYINKVVGRGDEAQADSKVEPAVLAFMNGDDSALDDDLPF